MKNNDNSSKALSLAVSIRRILELPEIQRADLAIRVLDYSANYLGEIGAKAPHGFSDAFRVVGGIQEIAKLQIKYSKKLKSLITGLLIDCLNYLKSAQFLPDSKLRLLISISQTIAIYGHVQIFRNMGESSQLVSALLDIIEHLQVVADDSSPKLILVLYNVRFLATRIDFDSNRLAKFLEKVLENPVHNADERKLGHLCAVLSRCFKKTRLDNYKIIWQMFRLAWQLEQVQKTIGPKSQINVITFLTFLSNKTFVECRVIRLLGQLKKVHYRGIARKDRPVAPSSYYTDDTPPPTPNEYCAEGLLVLLEVMKNKVISHVPKWFGSVLATVFYQKANPFLNHNYSELHEVANLLVLSAKNEIIDKKYTAKLHEWVLELLIKGIAAVDTIMSKSTTQKHTIFMHFTYYIDILFRPQLQTVQYPDLSKPVLTFCTKIIQTIDKNISNQVIVRQSISALLQLLNIITKPNFFISTNIENSAGDIASWLKAKSGLIKLYHCGKQTRDSEKLSMKLADIKKLLEQLMQRSKSLAPIKPTRSMKSTMPVKTLTTRTANEPSRLHPCIKMQHKLPPNRRSFFSFPASNCVSREFKPVLQGGPSPEVSDLTWQ